MPGTKTELFQELKTANRKIARNYTTVRPKISFLVVSFRATIYFEKVTKFSQKSNFGPKVTFLSGLQNNNLLNSNNRLQEPYKNKLSN